jgi:hypothetical protein
MDGEGARASNGVAEMTWRTIESAPPHTEFLVYIPTAKRHRVVEAWKNEWYCAFADKAVFQIKDRTGKPIYTATHWRPLPAPPEDDHAI